MSIVAVSRATSDGRWIETGIDLREYGVQECRCEYGPGWIAEVEYFDFTAPIRLADVGEELAALTVKHWPILRNGRVRQAYLTPFSTEGLNILFKASSTEWPKWVERQLMKKSEFLNRRIAVWIAQTLKKYDRADGFRLKRMDEDTRLENYHQWVDGQELFSRDTVVSPSGMTLDLLVIDWDGNGSYKLVVYPPNHSGPLVEIRKVLTIPPTLVLKWRYSPKKRGGMNEARVKRFVDELGGRDVELRLSDTKASVAEFLGTLFALVEARRQADRLDVQDIDLISPMGEAPDRVLRSVQERQGQQDFRANLLVAYNGRCAISGADAKEALEAAHIIPYNESSLNHVSNGLLLRADLHTLFDQGLIWINPETWTVEIADELKVTTYVEFENKRLQLPHKRSKRPNADWLRQHASKANSGR